MLHKHYCIPLFLNDYQQTIASTLLTNHTSVHKECEHLLRMAPSPSHHTQKTFIQILKELRYKK